MNKNEVKEKLKSFSCNSQDDGIMFFIPSNKIYEEKNLYCSIHFGSGCNIEDPTKHDGVININLYTFDGMIFDELDGGELDYLEETDNYGDDIRNAVADTLEFMFNEIPEFVPLHVFDVL